jgi:disulfide oxidoreductase YuzD
MINTIDREPMLKEQVLKTTDYFLFSFISGNRKVNTAHAKRLENSFKKRHLFSPIIVNEHYQIIDGQHRFTVCEKLKLPIYYIVVNGYGLDEVQLLNTNSSNWKKTEYLNSYCDLKFPEYLKFRNFLKTYPDFSFACAEMLLKLNAGKQSYQSKELVSETNKYGKYHIKTFEEGNFVCTNYHKSCEYAEKILELKKYNSKVINRVPFVSAMIQLLNNENFDHNEFTNKISQQPTALVDCVNVTEFKSLIEEIYNYKRRTKVNLRF